MAEKRVFKQIACLAQIQITPTYTLYKMEPSKRIQSFQLLFYRSETLSGMIVGIFITFKTNSSPKKYIFQLRVKMTPSLGCMALVKTPWWTRVKKEPKNQWA